MAASGEKKRSEKEHHVIFRRKTTVCFSGQGSPAAGSTATAVGSPGREPGGRYQAWPKVGEPAVCTEAAVVALFGPELPSGQAGSKGLKSAQAFVLRPE